MSVIYVSDQDLNCIYNSLVDVVVQPTFMMSISEKTLLSFVVRVGLCNRLAYQCTYHDDRSSEIVLKMPRIHETDCTVLPLKKLIEQLLLLDYNCVTNSGRCFLDSKDKELLEELVYHLRLRYIETLEKQKS